MKFIALTEFFGPADPTEPVFVNVEDISYIQHGLNFKNSVIVFKGGHSLDVAEDVDIVLAKIKGLTNG
jgi:hypothetical protein